MLAEEQEHKKTVKTARHAAKKIIFFFVISDSTSDFHSVVILSFFFLIVNKYRKKPQIDNETKINYKKHSDNSLIFNALIIKNQSIKKLKAKNLL